MKLGLQLFSLHNIAQSDNGLRKVIKHAAEAGYDGVEFAGFHGLTPAEVRAELDKYGLAACGIHLGWDNMNLENLDKNPEDVLNTAKIVGAESVTVASYGGTTYEEWVSFAQRINNYGKLFRENGIYLGYHNHRHEFKKINGKYIIDIFMENCERENVFWEHDPRHLVIAKVDPIEFARKYKDCSPFFHVRDMAEITGEDTGRDCAVGDGIVDVLGAVRESGEHKWLIVEETPEFSDEQMLFDIKRSAEYVRRNMF